MIQTLIFRRSGSHNFNSLIKNNENDTKCNYLLKFD